MILFKIVFGKMKPLEALELIEAEIIPKERFLSLMALRWFGQKSL